MNFFGLEFFWILLGVSSTSGGQFDQFDLDVVYLCWPCGNSKPLQLPCRTPELEILKIVRSNALSVIRSMTNSSSCWTLSRSMKSSFAVSSTKLWRESFLAMSARYSHDQLLCSIQHRQSNSQLSVNSKTTQWRLLNQLLRRQDQASSARRHRRLLHVLRQWARRKTRVVWRNHKPVKPTSSTCRAGISSSTLKSLFRLKKPRPKPEERSTRRNQPQNRRRRQGSARQENSKWQPKPRQTETGNNDQKQQQHYNHQSRSNPNRVWSTNK